MISTLILATILVVTLRWWYRQTHPPILHGCPLCPERVEDVAWHLDIAHDGADWFCWPCARNIPDETKAAHWRLAHVPAPEGHEPMGGAR